MAKIELTVAGHSVSIEAEDSLEAVADMALRLFRDTTDDAQRSPVGYSAGAVVTEISPQDQV